MTIKFMILEMRFSLLLGNRKIIKEWLINKINEHKNYLFCSWNYS